MSLFIAHPDFRMTCASLLALCGIVNGARPVTRPPLHNRFVMSVEFRGADPDISTTIGWGVGGEGGDQVNWRETDDAVQQRLGC